MNIGLALSGGGIRGAAHIGAIKALEEHNITITHIAGTSAGAVVGALYAYGYTWEEMLVFFNKIELFSIKTYALNKPGFIDPEKYYSFFKGYFPEDNFNTLKRELSITTTNILEGKLEVFTTGELIKPILASSAFPGVFSPMHINNKLYVDGGVLNNFPVELLTEKCDKIIGVYVNHFGTIKAHDLKHFHNIIERAINVRIAKDDIKKFADCDLVIAPKILNQYGLFDKKNSDAIFKIGYDSMSDAITNMRLKIKKELGVM